MKKITESELKARVNRLKEYMAEMGMAPGAVGGPQASTTTPGKISPRPAPNDRIGYAKWNAQNADKYNPDGTPKVGTNQSTAPSGVTKGANNAALDRAEVATPGSIEQINSIKNMQKELGVTPDGKIGPATQAAMKAKPDIASKYAQDQVGAKIYAGVKKPTQATSPATTTVPTDTAPHVQTDIEKDINSADNAGDINKGLTPDDPRWTGPKPQDKVKAALPNNMSYDQYKQAMDRSEPDLPGGQPASLTRSAAAPAATTKPAVANPYKDPAQAAKFAALTPQDQAWLTKGGGVPDITDDLILRRAPNGGKPANGSAPAPVTKPVTSGNPVNRSSDYAGESVAYNEDQALARIVQLARG
jgi:hypothetical protein